MLLCRVVTACSSSSSCCLLVQVLQLVQQACKVYSPTSSTAQHSQSITLFVNQLPSINSLWFPVRVPDKHSTTEQAEKEWLKRKPKLLLG
jgi:hypothetical protein